MITHQVTTQQETTGADVLLRAAAGRGVSVCFANPGTTEMPLVTALDRTPGLRAVLGLHENVCTGAAYGYARITRHAPLTLLHRGPEPPGDEAGRDAPRRRVDTDAVERVAREVRAANGQVIFILGGDGLSRAAQHAAGRIAAATGTVLYSETFPARAERGGGLPSVDRLPYFPEAAVQALRPATA